MELLRAADRGSAAPTRPRAAVKGRRSKRRSTTAGATQPALCTKRRWRSTKPKRWSTPIRCDWSQRWASEMLDGWRVSSPRGPTLCRAKRRSRVHAGLGWSWGDQSRLDVAAGLEARSDQAWKLVAPTQLSYRAAFGELSASIAYRHAFGQDDFGTWTASVIGRPGGLNAYTRLESNVNSSRWTVGARQGWAITDEITVSLAAEGGTGSSDSARTALVMDLSYRPVGGASKATLTREIASSKAGRGRRRAARGRGAGSPGWRWN